MLFNASSEDQLEQTVKNTSKTDKEIIPMHVPDQNALTASEIESVTQKRNTLISELRCISGLPEIVSSFSQDSVYKLVLVPEGAHLFKDAHGNLKGVFYKDGKILEHAKLEEIKPSALKAAKAVGAQILLVSIAMQLNRIEKQIGKIFAEFHGDRIAEINAGKELFLQACSMKNNQHREQIIIHAIAKLQEGFEKTVSALARQIREIPEQELSFFDNWISNKSKQAEGSHKMALESFFACLNALQFQARSYLFLDERKTALSAVESGLEKIEKAGVRMAYERSRLIHKINNQFPEEIWKQFIDYRKQCDKNYFTNLIESRNNIEIEINPSLIKGVSHV